MYADERGRLWHKVVRGRLGHKDVCDHQALLGSGGENLLVIGKILWRRVVACT